MLYLPKDFSFVLLTKPISWIIIKNWKKRSAVCDTVRSPRYHHRVWKRKTYISSYEIIRIVFTTCWKFPRDSNTKWCTIEAFISAFLGLWSFTMLCLIICNGAGTRHIYENCAEIQNVKLLIWKSCFAFSLFFFFAALLILLVDSKCCPHPKIRYVSFLTIQGTRFRRLSFDSIAVIKDGNRSRVMNYADEIK